jgi:hypothetical protein
LGAVSERPPELLVGRDADIRTFEHVLDELAGDRSRAITLTGHARSMHRYLLHHRHEPRECGVVFASFKGFTSRLRHQTTLASCRSGGHEIWWTIDAAAETDALRLLPTFVAARTSVVRVSEVDIP